MDDRRAEGELDLVGFRASVVWLRYGTLFAFVIIMIGWHSFAWRRQRERRMERQRRWGLRE